MNYELELSDIKTIDEFHDRVSDQMNFPDYYGRNKDAFWDCIRILEPNDIVVVNGIETIPKNIRTLIDPYMGLLKEMSEAIGASVHID